MNMRLVAVLVGAAICTSFSGSALTAAPVEEAYLQREVGHQLRSLLYYTVFDIIKYQIDGNNVILEGAVTQPYVKTDAENAVKSIEGVGMVIDNIKVLPNSSNDDHIRRAVFRSLYGENSPLFHYAVAAAATIHIIVENGRVTLEGAVDSPMDKEIAELYTKMAPGVFSVMDNLQVVAPAHH